MKKFFVIIFVLLAVLIGIGLYLFKNQPEEELLPIFQEVKQVITPIINPSTPYPLLSPTSSKTLSNNYHIFQSFNNCGPAALSMTLSYFGINVSQQVLGQELRPYQNSIGDNDDKSVTLTELAEKSKEYNFIPYHRPNGDIEKIKLFISYDIPVITRTWLKENEDVGHYRVIKGYDDLNKTIIQDDSLQGKNLIYSYSGFNAIWKKFNYEYLVLVPSDKKQIAEAILKEEANAKNSWRKAAENARSELKQNTDDVYATFNLSVALYNIGDYRNSVLEFEKVKDRLSFRTLWYQIEPIQAYYELGQFDKVFQITDQILNNHNRAFSELYIIRGDIYLKQNNKEAARSEYEKAVFYNKNLQEAIDKLNSIQ